MPPLAPASIRRLTRDTRAAALVEFALLLPMLATLLWGVMAYGQYLMLAHNVQQVANDAARATIAGLTAAERRALAQATVAAELARLPALEPARAVTVEGESGQIVTVTVRYDAGNSALFRVPLVPLPSAVIERRAVVRTGGFA